MKCLIAELDNEMLKFFIVYVYVAKYSNNKKYNIIILTVGQ